MKYNIFYFSGTGNTKLITEKLKLELEKFNNDAYLYPIDKINGNTNIDLSDSVIGIGFPVYKFTYPEIIKNLFPILKENTKTKMPFFVYSTYCRFNSNSLHSLAKDVEKLNYSLIAKKSFKCPSNGIASLQSKDSFEYRSVMYFENRIDLNISEFSNKIIENTGKYINNGYHEKHHGSLIDKVRINFVDKIEKARYPRLQVDDSSCVLCGVCIKNCPESNLKIIDSKISIADDRNCLHCLRCMHICKKHAITFGQLTKGPLRYTKDIQKELYKKAINTPKKAPEIGTKKVKIQWALNNFKYWLFHR